MPPRISPEILLPLSGQVSDETLIHQALQVSNAVGGHVEAVFAQSDPADIMIWSGDGVFSSIPSTLVEAAWSGADEAWSNVQAQIQGFHQDEAVLKVERLLGPIDASLARRAALADFVVFSCEVARGKGLLSGAFEAMVMEARAAILIPRKPPEAIAGALVGAVMIAWNGSLEGGRAVKAAMPFLAAANRVLIARCGAIGTDFGTELCDPTQLQAKLARSGIKSEVLQLQGTDVGQALLDASAEQGVGLIVGGAYGHSRAREFIFGGVTRTLLQSPLSPSLLLSH